MDEPLLQLTGVPPSLCELKPFGRYDSSAIPFHLAESFADPTIANSYRPTCLFDMLH